MSVEGTLIKHRYQIEYIDNVDISSVEQVDYKKNDIKSYIDKCKADLLALAVATPKDIVSNSEDSPFDVIKEKVNDILDDLSDNYYDYWTVEHIESILNEWEYGWRNSEYELFDNTKTNNEINENAFPEEKFIEIQRNKNSFSFSPQDDDVEETIDRSIKNIELTDNQSNFYSDKYVIFYKNTLLSNYDGQCIFKNENAAKKVLQHRLNINPLDFISGEFITNHPKFFSTLIECARRNEFSEDSINNFNSAFNIFVGNKFKYCGEMEIMYNFIEDVVTKDVCSRLNIRIVNISDIVNYII